MLRAAHLGEPESGPWGPIFPLDVALPTLAARLIRNRPVGKGLQLPTPVLRFYGFPVPDTAGCRSLFLPVMEIGVML